MALGGQELYVVDRIVASQTKATSTVVVYVKVVRVNSVLSCLAPRMQVTSVPYTFVSDCQIHSFGHDGSNGIRLGIDPPFPVPALELRANVFFRKVVLVRAPVLYHCISAPSVDVSV